VRSGDFGTSAVTGSLGRSDLSWRSAWITGGSLTFLVGLIRLAGVCPQSSLVADSNALITFLNINKPSELRTKFVGRCFSR